ncbi:MAG: hypothetical protein APF81_08545 [Desulfosporosinus sp. BRH_c37]|nr:MAG: hypothetical protein APF81_08545 [Desulfosporosinus sp. BRH_c37]
MAGKMFEIAFQLAGKVNSSFNSTFQNANQRLEQLQERSDRIGTKIGLAFGGAALAAGATGLAVGGLAVNLSDNLQKSLNGVQSATGVADEMMGSMKDTMLAIYNDNFGENFADIGAAMTTVSQQTGLAGDALKKVTEDGLALNDTFGLEVADSVKSANQLMKQFGMDGDTAYNLIAQGAQWGLDSNGDLLDTLNEYSGTFAAQGFSAEEMFNMLSNASQSGIRDLDLAADAIKEFGIRSKDGSKTSAEGFEALGLNASKMTAAFAAGGETGKAAFDKTTKALFEMKDPVAQNAAGVALFGTQWEDLGVKGVKALMNTEGEISKSVDALGKINSVKYNTFGEAAQGIKRNLETGILLPLGEQIMPKMNEFSGWINTNMPAIKNEISYAMNVVTDNAPLVVAAVGTIAAVYVTYEATLLASKVATTAVTIAQNIHTGAMTAHNIIVGIATAAQWGHLVAMESGSVGLGVIAAAQWAFNAALTANPIGVVIIALAVLGAGIYALVKNWDSVTGAIEKAWKWLTKWNGTDAEDKEVSANRDSYNALKSNDAVGENAGGTDDWRGGLTWVGEEGPEIINAPGGSQIIPNNSAISLLGAKKRALNDSSGNNAAKNEFTFHFHISGGNKEEIAPLLEKAKSEFEGIVDRVMNRRDQEKRRVAYG